MIEPLLLYICVYLHINTDFMKAYKLLVILAAAVAGLVFCGCGEDKGPEIIREVSRMNHFLRIDISNSLLALRSR